MNEEEMVRCLVVVIKKKYRDLNGAENAADEVSHGELA